MGAVKAKCVGDGVWCSQMDAVLAPEANQRVKGVVQINITSMQTGNQRIAGIAYRTKASDRGVFLNVCPWCGEPIGPTPASRASGAGGGDE